MAGGNWWRANEIVIRHLTRRTDLRYRSRDSAGRPSQGHARPRRELQRRHHPPGERGGWEGISRLEPCPATIVDARGGIRHPRTIGKVCKEFGVRASRRRAPRKVAPQRSVQYAFGVGRRDQRPERGQLAAIAAPRPGITKRQSGGTDPGLSGDLRVVFGAVTTGGGGNGPSFPGRGSDERADRRPTVRRRCSDPRGLSAQNTRRTTAIGLGSARGPLQSEAILARQLARSEGEKVLSALRPWSRRQPCSMRRPEPAPAMPFKNVAIPNRGPLPPPPPFILAPAMSTPGRPRHVAPDLNIRALRLGERQF